MEENYWKNRMADSPLQELLSDWTRIPIYHQIQAAQCISAKIDDSLYRIKNAFIQYVCEECGFQSISDDDLSSLIENDKTFDFLTSIFPGPKNPQQVFEEFENTWLANDYMSRPSVKKFHLKSSNKNVCKMWEIVCDLCEDDEDLIAIGNDLFVIK
jgi:hypothetical protein